MPAIAQMAAAQMRISTKLKWMPISSAATPETPRWTCALKKKLEPNQPIE